MNYEFHNPTRLIFGASNLTRLGEVVKEKGNRALLVPAGAASNVTEPSIGPLPHSSRQV